MTPAAEQSCLSLCPSVPLSVCPAIKAYISVTMSWILMKLGENVGTLVRLIVLKFERSAAKGNTTHKGLKFYPSYSLLFFNYPYLKSYLAYILHI